MTTEIILPPNITNVPQAGQEAPGSIVTQLPGTVQYIPYGGYQLANPGNPLQQQNNPSQQQHNPLEKLLKVETKTLGAIQIMIGLMHIGLGCIAISISMSMSRFYYIAIGAISGYPFWGGLFFIASGSLAVSSEKYLNGSLVRCSVGMNITSAVIALIGIMLYIAELVITTTYYYYYYNFDDSHHYYYFSRAGPVAVEVLFLLFSLLEFCINVSTAHFGCQAACCTSTPVTVFVPYTSNIAIVSPPESNPTPPNYNDIAHPPKMETQ